jgi:hypothetical protein
MLAYAYEGVGRKGDEYTVTLRNLVYFYDIHNLSYFSSTRMFVFSNISPYTTLEKKKELWKTKRHFFCVFREKSNFSPSHLKLRMRWLVFTKKKENNVH